MSESSEFNQSGTSAFIGKVAGSLLPRLRMFGGEYGKENASFSAWWSEEATVQRLQDAKRVETLREESREGEVRVVYEDHFHRLLWREGCLLLERKVVAFALAMPRKVRVTPFPACALTLFIPNFSTEYQGFRTLHHFSVRLPPSMSHHPLYQEDKVLTGTNNLIRAMKKTPIAHFEECNGYLHMDRCPSNYESMRQNADQSLVMIQHLNDARNMLHVGYFGSLIDLDRLRNTGQLLPKTAEKRGLEIYAYRS